MKSLGLFVFVVLAFASGGCAPDMTPSSLLIRSRGLAGKITVDAEPTRSNPAPGESATVEVFVGDPAAEPPRTWALVVCEPVPTTFGTPFCTSFDPAAALGQSAQTVLPTTAPYAPPRVSFTVPAASELAEGTKELLMIGAICSGGVVDVPGVVAYFAALAEGGAEGAPPVCENGVGDGELVTLRIPLLLDGQENAQPRIAVTRRDGILFDATVPDDTPADGCLSLGTSVPFLPVSSPEVRLDLTITSDSVETFTEFDDQGVGTQATETIQITYVATAGEMDRTFGFIDPEEQTLTDSVGWNLPAPAVVPPEGLLVRFYFVLRDGRGGVDFATRALCVAPGG